MEHAENSRKGFERKMGGADASSEEGAGASEKSEARGGGRRRRARVSNPVKFEAGGRGVRKTVLAYNGEEGTPIRRRHTA